MACSRSRSQSANAVDVGSRAISTSSFSSPDSSQRLDAGPGESGAPYYYYPGGCCGSHYVTGLHSGFVNPGIGKSYNGGPKGPKFRDWVIANI